MQIKRYKGTTFIWVTICAGSWKSKVDVNKCTVEWILPKNIISECSEEMRLVRNHPVFTSVTVGMKTIWVLVHFSDRSDQTQDPLNGRGLGGAEHGQGVGGAWAGHGETHDRKLLFSEVSPCWTSLVLPRPTFSENLPDDFSFPQIYFWGLYVRKSRGGRGGGHVLLY